MSLSLGRSERGPGRCGDASRATSRLGFTLVELLVVIAIIGVLIALLLPAVQAARESARRSSCSSNMKQVGLAINGYYDSKKKIPPGGIQNYAPNYGPLLEAGGSLLMFLLPYVEQQELYDQYNFTSPTYTQVTTPGSGNYVDIQKFAGTSTYLNSVTIPVYLCASDPPIGGSVGLFNYGGSGGANQLSTTGNLDPYGPCPCPQSYPNGGNPFAPYSVSLGAGPFVRYRYIAHPEFSQNPITTPVYTYKNVTDGLSKTIFLGEVRPQCSGGVSCGWGSSGAGHGGFSTQMTLNFDSCENASAPQCNQPCNGNTSSGYKSSHPGGVQFEMGDGSVHFISNDIAWQSLQYLGGMADGYQAVLPPE